MLFFGIFGLFLAQIYFPTQYKPLTNRLISYPGTTPALVLNRGIFQVVHTPAMSNSILPIRAKSQLTSYLPQVVTVAMIGGDEGGIVKKPAVYVPKVVAPKIVAPVDKMEKDDPVPKPVVKPVVLTPQTQTAREEFSCGERGGIWDKVKKTCKSPGVQPIPIVVVTPTTSDPCAEVCKASPSGCTQCRANTNNNKPPSTTPPATTNSNQTTTPLTAQQILDKQRQDSYTASYGTATGRYGYNYTTGKPATTAEWNDPTHVISGTYVAPNGKRYNVAIDSTEKAAGVYVNNMSSSIATLSDVEILALAKSKNYTNPCGPNDTDCQQLIIQATLAEIIKDSFAGNVDPRLVVAITEVQHTNAVEVAKQQVLIDAQNAKNIADNAKFQAKVKDFLDPTKSLNELAGCTGHPGECRGLTAEDYLKELGVSPADIPILLTGRQDNLKTVAEAKQLQKTQIDIVNEYLTKSPAQLKDKYCPPSASAIVCEAMLNGGILRTAGIAEDVIKNVVNQKDAAALLTDYQTGSLVVATLPVHTGRGGAPSVTAQAAQIAKKEELAIIEGCKSLGGVNCNTKADALNSVAAITGMTNLNAAIIESSKLKVTSESKSYANVESTLRNLGKYEQVATAVAEGRSTWANVEKILDSQQQDGWSKFVVGWNDITAGRFKRGNDLLMSQYGDCTGVTTWSCDYIGTDHGLTAFKGALIQGGDAAMVVTAAAALPLAYVPLSTIGIASATTAVGTSGFLITGLGVAGSTQMIGTAADTCELAKQGQATESDCRKAIAMASISVAGNGLGVISQATKAVQVGNQVSNLTKTVGIAAQAPIASKVLYGVELATDIVGTATFTSMAIDTCGAEGVSQFDCASSIAMAVASGGKLFTNSINLVNKAHNVEQSVSGVSQFGNKALQTAHTFSADLFLVSACSKLFDPEMEKNSDTVSMCAFGISGAASTRLKVPKVEEKAPERIGANERIATPAELAALAGLAKVGETALAIKTPVNAEVTAGKPIAPGEAPKAPVTDVAPPAAPPAIPDAPPVAPPQQPVVANTAPVVAPKGFLASARELLFGKDVAPPVVVDRKITLNEEYRTVVEALGKLKETRGESALSGKKSAPILVAETATVDGKPVTQFKFNEAVADRAGMNAAHLEKLNKVFSEYQVFSDKNIGFEASKGIRGQQADYLMAGLEAFAAKGTTGSLFGAIPGLGKTEVILPMLTYLHASMTNDPQFILFPEAKLMKPWATADASGKLTKNTEIIKFFENKFGEGSVLILEANILPSAAAIAKAKIIISTRDVAFNLQSDGVFIDRSASTALRNKWKSTFKFIDESHWTTSLFDYFRSSWKLEKIGVHTEARVFNEALDSVRKMKSIDEIVEARKSGKALDVKLTSDGKTGEYTSEREIKILNELLKKYESSVPGLKEIKLDPINLVESKKQIDQYIDSNFTKPNVKKLAAELTMVNKMADLLASVPGTHYGLTTKGGEFSIAPREQSRPSGRTYSNLAEQILYNTVGVEILKGVGEMRSNIRVNVDNLTISTGGSTSTYARLLLEGNGFIMLTGTPEQTARLYKIAYGVELKVFSASAFETVSVRFPSSENNGIFTKIVEQIKARIGEKQNQVYTFMDGKTSNIEMRDSLVTHLQENETIFIVKANGEFAEGKVVGGKYKEVRFFESAEAMGMAQDAAVKYKKIYEFGAHTGVDTPNNVELSRAVGICNGCDQTTFSQGINRVRLDANGNPVPMDIIVLDAALQNVPRENLFAEFSKLSAEIEAHNMIVAEVNFKEILLKTSVEIAFERMLAKTGDGIVGTLLDGGLKAKLEALQRDWNAINEFNYKLDSTNLTPEQKLQRTLDQVQGVMRGVDEVIGSNRAVRAEFESSVGGYRDLAIKFNTTEVIKPLGQRPTMADVVELINNTSVNLKDTTITFRERGASGETIAVSGQEAVNNLQASNLNQSQPNIISRAVESITNLFGGNQSLNLPTQILPTTTNVANVPITNSVVPVPVAKNVKIESNHQFINIAPSEIVDYSTNLQIIVDGAYSSNLNTKASIASKLTYAIPLIINGIPTTLKPTSFIEINIDDEIEYGYQTIKYLGVTQKTIDFKITKTKEPIDNKVKLDQLAALPLAAANPANKDLFTRSQLDPFRRSQIDAYKDMVVTQYTNLQTFYNALTAKINSDSQADESALQQFALELSLDMSLADAEIQNVQQALHDHLAKREKVAELLNPKLYPTKELLWQAAFGTLPTGDIVLRNSPFTIEFVTNNDVDFATAYFLNDVVISNDKTKKLAGFKITSDTIIPRSGGIFTISKANKDFNETELTILHEREHAFYEVIQLALTPASLTALESEAQVSARSEIDLLISNDPSVNNSSSYYSLQFNGKPLLLDSVINQDKKIKALANAASNYAFLSRRKAENAVADELIARITELVIGSKNVKSIVTQMSFAPDLFNYITEQYIHNRNSKKTESETESYNYNYFVEGRDDASVEGFIVLSHGVDSAEFKAVSAVFDRVFSDAEQAKVATRAIDAYKTMILKGYSHDEAVALLSTTRLAYWGNVARRVPISTSIPKTPVDSFIMQGLKAAEDTRLVDIQSAANNSLKSRFNRWVLAILPAPTITSNTQPIAEKALAPTNNPPTQIQTQPKTNEDSGANAPRAKSVVEENIATTVESKTQTTTPTTSGKLNIGNQIKNRANLIFGRANISGNFNLPLGVLKFATADKSDSMTYTLLSTTLNNTGFHLYHITGTNPDGREFEVYVDEIGDRMSGKKYVSSNETPVLNYPVVNTFAYTAEIDANNIEVVRTDASPIGFEIVITDTNGTRETASKMFPGEINLTSYNLADIVLEPDFESVEVVSNEKVKYNISKSEADGKLTYTQTDADGKVASTHGFVAADLNSLPTGVQESVKYNNREIARDAVSSKNNRVTLQVPQRPSEQIAKVIALPSFSSMIFTFEDGATQTITTSSIAGNLDITYQNKTSNTSSTIHISIAEIELYLPRHVSVASITYNNTLLSRSAYVAPEINVTERGKPSFNAVDGSSIGVQDITEANNYRRPYETNNQFRIRVQRMLGNNDPMEFGLENLKLPLFVRVDRQIRLYTAIIRNKFIPAIKGLFVASEVSGNPVVIVHETEAFKSTENDYVTKKVAKMIGLDIRYAHESTGDVGYLQDMDRYIGVTALKPAPSGNISKAGLDVVRENVKAEITRLFNNKAKSNNLLNLIQISWQTNKYIDLLQQAIDEGDIKISGDTLTLADIQYVIARNIHTLAFQEWVSAENTLGTHGIRHLIEHNIRVAEQLLDEAKLHMSSKYQLRAMDYLITHQIMIDHDTGYATDIVRAGVNADATKGADSGHNVLAAKMIRERTESGTDPLSRLFGAEGIARIHQGVINHDSSKVDIGVDAATTVDSAIHLADNTHAFESKLPEILYGYPEAFIAMRLLKAAGEMGNTELVAKIRQQLIDIIRDKEDIGIDDKVALSVAINTLTPKSYAFTIGRIMGTNPVVTFDKETQKVTVTVRENDSHRYTSRWFDKAAYDQLGKFIADLLGIKKDEALARINTYDPEGNSDLKFEGSNVIIQAIIGEKQKDKTKSPFEVQLDAVTKQGTSFAVYTLADNALHREITGYLGDIKKLLSGTDSLHTLIALREVSNITMTLQSGETRTFGNLDGKLTYTVSKDEDSGPGESQFIDPTQLKKLLPKTDEIKRVYKNGKLMEEGSYTTSTEGERTVEINEIEESLAKLIDARANLINDFLDSSKPK